MIDVAITGYGSSKNPMPLRKTHSGSDQCRFVQRKQASGRSGQHSCASLLQQTGSSKALSGGNRVHWHIASSTGRHRDTFAGNLLVQMYGKCGSLEEARSAFKQITEKNVFSWNMMIGAYTKNGHLQDAKNTFASMPQTNYVSWNLMIAAYTQNGYLEDARSMFEEMPQWNVITWNSMIAGYAQNGYLEEAQCMFDRMPQQSVVTWTAMLAAYAQHSCVVSACVMFEKMPERNDVSWNAMLQAHARDGHVEDAKAMLDKMPQQDVVSCTAMVTAYAQKGELLAARSMFNVIPYRDRICWNAMLSAYAQNGDPVNARDMFVQMPKRDDFSWNAMIQAYAENGHLHGARTVFDKMPLRDAVSWTTMLVASTQNGLVQDAKSLFDEMPLHTVVSWTAMLAAYAQHGYLRDAKRMFERIPQQDELSWSAMIAAYALNGYGNKALELFRLMDLEGLKADAVTYVSAIDACASLAALAEGKLFHAAVVESGFESEVVVGNALVNMYGKCGQLHCARNVFDKMPQRNAVSWTGLISAYAQNGHGDGALELFQLMKLEDMQPDGVTLMSILNVCSHAGLADDGLEHFVTMVGDYGIKATLDHYVCIIDILGRAGRLDEAEDLINNMPYEPTGVAWMTLLGACKSSDARVEIGARAAEQVLRLEPNNAAAYILLSSIHGNENLTTTKLDQYSPG